MRTIIEAERGCGYRVPGGLYLVSDPGALACTLMPFPLVSCPTCGGGVKPSRAWTWVQPDELLAEVYRDHGEPSCPLREPGHLGERCGLLWVGDRFYTPRSFLQEAMAQGVSRRLPAIPRDFEIGQHVLIGHRQAITSPFLHESEPEPVPGVFAIWRPQRWEYVVKGDETEDELAKIVKRGIEPVIVKRDVEVVEIPFTAEDHETAASAIKRRLSFLRRR